MLAEFACLHSAEASLVLECRAAAPPLWRHCGALVDVSWLPGMADCRTAASFSLDDDVPFSLAPPAGLGWFGPEVLRARRGDQRILAEFDAVTVDSDETGITITARDAVNGIELIQTITPEPGGAFVFAATLQNSGTQPLTLDWLASAMIPLATSAAALISWRGRHNGELVELREPMPEQCWQRERRRGISGHGGPPAVIVLDAGASHHTGLVHALQLAWSGDTLLAVERDDEGYWILSAGAVLQPGEVVLGPGERFAAPAAMLAVSTQGRNGAMAQQHAAVRGEVTWPGGKMSPRKVHLNSWEACYFDHDERRIAQLAEAAAAIGVERFVLDDGWFAGRNDDSAGLGDWTPDRIKYPAGLKPLAQRVNALGMEFGLWVEPEMVNPDSDLYRAHPDWVLALPGRARPAARGQLVLNLAHAEVRDYLFVALDKLLRDVPIAYLKWDHNRDLAPAGGHAQVQGTYALLERLRSVHPGVEIESCAGGGGRSDAGMARYAHRFWTSDNIDAVSRVAMQRGFQAFLPPEMMGAHVGASPAHATGRSQSLGFRAAVALPGHFGLELDPAALAPAERDELAGWIAFYKHWRHLLHGGWTVHGTAADGLVWHAQGTGDEFLLFLIRCDPPLDRRPQPVKLPFLHAAKHCDLQLLRIGGEQAGHAAQLPALHQAMQAAPQRFAGTWLAQAGLPIPPLRAETVAIFHGKVAP